MTNPPRLAFIGRMRAGKDTAADHLRSIFGGKTLKFADPLYAMQDVIYKIARLEPLPPGQKDRLLLQWLGTGWGRNTIDKDIWIHAMDANLSDMVYDAPLYITDCRFLNEYTLMKKHGFTLIKINRPLEERLRFGATNLDHESEIALDVIPDSGYDYVLENSGTLQDFHHLVDSMYSTILTGLTGYHHDPLFISGNSSLREDWRPLQANC